MDRKNSAALVITLLLVPLLALTACEGYDGEPGAGEYGESEIDQMNRGPTQTDGQDRAMQDAEDSEIDETESRTQQRREERPPASAEERSTTPGSPAPPAPTAPEDSAMADADPAMPTGDPETRSDASRTLMTVTELSVEMPQDISAGSYTLSCPVPADARRDRTGSSGQATREDVQLRIRVQESQAP